MTKLSDRLEALVADCEPINLQGEFGGFAKSVGRQQNTLEALMLLAQNLPTILQALKDKDL